MSAVPFRLPSRSHPPYEASRLRRIRRYAVPRWMIEQAAERRLAGDWRGACAAANVDIAFDLADVAHEHGAAVAAALEDDLLHFAPDLLRWHAPRNPGEWTTIRAGHRVVLSGPGDRHPAAPYLHVVTPERPDAPQRLVLRFGPVDERDGPWAAWRVHDWTRARHLWDVRHAGELRERCGGGDRAPFFEADGTPRTALPTAAPGPGDPAAHTGWVTLLHERGEVEAAFAAGLDLDPTPYAARWSYTMEPLAMLERLAVGQASASPRACGSWPTPSASRSRRSSPACTSRPTSPACRSSVPTPPRRACRWHRRTGRSAWPRQGAASCSSTSCPPLPRPCRPRCCASSSNLASAA